MPKLDLTGLQNALGNEQPSNNFLPQNPQEPTVVSEWGEPVQQEEQWDLTGIEDILSPKAKNIPTKDRKFSSGYGERTDPITGKKSFHPSWDLPLEPNTPLHPFAAGKVFFAGKRSGYGNSVGIDYGNGIQIYFNHLNKIASQLDDLVLPDAIVGFSGNSGRSTGPHLDLQVLKDGKPINPNLVFNEDPKEVGIALTLKNQILNGEDVELSATKAKSEDWDLSGIEEIIKPEEQSIWDLEGLKEEVPDVINEQGNVDTDVIKFNPAEKPKGVGYGQLFKEGFEPHIAEMAKGIASVEQFIPKPRTKNPNAPGKPVTFSVIGVNGKPPSLEVIHKELARVLNLTELNEKFKNDKELKGRGGLSDNLVYLPNPDVRKNPDGTWQVVVEQGLPSGAVELINAYARGGAKAFSAKKKELIDRSKVYEEDINQQKLQFEKLQAFRREHPYVNLLLDPSRSIVHGAQDAALSELQLMHSVSMLPRAISIAGVDGSGTSSEEYLSLMKEDAKAQIALDKAAAAIPKEETILASAPRSLTSSVLALPRFMAIGKAGSWALPTMTYVENLHRGNTEAAKAALPMALMVGSMHGMEKFIASGGNPLDLFKKSEIANKDLIASIKAESPGNFNYHLMSNLEPFGIPVRHIDFKAITPFQRQLVLRGTNALVNVGTTAATNPQAGIQGFVDSAIIGLALPVGKGSRGREVPFARRSILSGDAYTLPDGSVLLKAGIDNESGLISGRIQDFTAINPPSIFEERATSPRPFGSIEGKTVYEVPPARQLSTGTVDIGTPTKSVIIPIDQAALNFLDLRRAYEQGTYFQNIPAQSTQKIGKFNVIADQRRQDILSAIKILGEAIPKETLEYFEKNETLIREAIRTNYEDRITKEEFVLGKKIIRKPADKLTLADVRPYNPKEPASRTATQRKSSIDNFVQTARRTMVSVEEAGKRGLEANKKNKGTLNMGLDPSDVPYLVQIAIGKLGRKGLDAAQFTYEMIAEHGPEFVRYSQEVYKQARDFIDGVNSLADVLTSDFGTPIPKSLGVKEPPFRRAEFEQIKNIYYIGSKYLTSAKEQDIPLDKVVATQTAVNPKKLLKFGEDPYLAITSGKTDLAGNVEVPKAVKIGDEYFLFDGHHRTSAEKLRGAVSIKGRVIDFEEVINGSTQTRQERAIEKFGDTGKDNKWFTQEKQLEVRENFLSPPKTSELQEGFTASSKWIANNFSNLVQIAGFHVEDLYRRKVEPTVTEVVGRLRAELGDWVDSISGEKWKDIFDNAIRYYQSNNADPFFSGLKQNVLEQFPVSIKAESAKALLLKYGTKNEIEWTSGLMDWIDGKIKNGEKVSQKELLDVISRGQVKVDEVVLKDYEMEIEALQAKKTELYKEQDAIQKRIYEILKAPVTENYEEGLKLADRKNEIQKEVSKVVYEIGLLQDKPKTRYDLKTYTSERLELEGGRNPKEVLLQVPRDTSNLIRKPEILRVEKEESTSWRATGQRYRYQVYNEENVPMGPSIGFTTEELANQFADKYWKDFYAHRYKTENYTHSHYPYENYFAHFRANERETIDGLKVFHSEEFQSDWNQAGRKEGYKGDENKRLVEIQNQVFEKSSSLKQMGAMSYTDVKNLLGIEVANEWADLMNTNGPQRGYNVPRNPFMENNWKELAFKRFLRMGIEMGKDGISWTTSEQQRQRYKKTIETKRLEYIKEEDGKYSIGVHHLINGMMYPDELKSLTLNQAKEYIGPEFTEAIRKDSEYKRILYQGEVSGEGLVVLSKFSDYDTYFVNLAKKIGKKFGAEYKVKEIVTIDNTETLDFLNARYLLNHPETGLKDEGLYAYTDNGEINQQIKSISELDALYAQADVRFSNGKPNNKKVEQVHYLEITPQMRDSILKEGLPFYGLGENNPLKSSAPSGTRNKIITRDVFDSAKNEIVKSIQDVVDNEGGTGTVLNSGLNPDAFLSQVKLLYKGWNDFTEFSKSMIRRYGERISPHLENIWNYVKESATKFNEDERGFLNFGKRKKLNKGEELDTFNDNRSSRFRNISIKAHRGIALAQIYEPYGQVYETMRGLQRTTNAYSTTILEQLSRAINLIKKDIDQKTAEAIFTRNEEGIQDPAQDAIVIARLGLNAEQTKAYHYIRAAVSNNLDLQRDKILYKEHQTVANINDQLTNLGLPTSGTPINAQHGDLLTKLVDAYDRIQEIDDYFQGLKDSGYISLMRLGRYRAELENPNVPVQIPVIVKGKPTAKLKNNPDRFFVDYADSPEDAQKRINEWKEQHNLTNKGKILDAHNPSDFREMSRKLTPGEFEEIVAGAKVKNTPEVEALRAEVYEQYPTMGYQLRRELYPGYKRNNEFMIKSIAHQAQVYASSYYNTLGREEGLRSLENTGLEKTDRELYNIARHYIEDETSTPQFNNFDLAAYKARKFTYMMQLAHQFKQFILNAAVQPITQNYSYLARVENPNTGKRLGGINEVERVFLEGTKLSLQLAKANLETRAGISRTRSSKYNEFESIYNQLKNERVIEPEFTKSLLELEAEEAGQVDRQFQGKLKRFTSLKQHEHWGGAFMRAGEVTTRTQMAASMFVAGKKFGLSGDALTNFIVRGIDATQTNPTRGENPYYIRRIGEAGKLFYQFGAFRHMWFENLALNVKSDWKHRNISATSRTVAPMAIMAGITGLPLSGLAMTLYGLTTGKNPDDRLRRWVKRTIADNDTLESLVLYGNIGSAAFSQSAGVQVPILDTLGEQLTQDSWWDTLFSNNVPALMTFKQIGQGLAGIAEGIWEKDGLKVLIEGAKAAPIPGNKTLRDIAKTNQVYYRGYETPSGENILSRNKVTAPKLAGQLFGFAPNELSEFYQRKRYKKLKTSTLGKATRRLIKRL